MSSTLLILGASARAAAGSAGRAGLAPVCGDLFADADLQACYPTTRVERYPAGLLAVAAASKADAWIYTGGLENYPRLVERVGRLLPLWGNPSQTLRAVRDPQRVAQIVRAAGLPCPPIRGGHEDLPIDGSWLRKLVRSAGGAGVRVWRGTASGELASAPAIGRGDRRGWCFQRRMPGLPCAALYVAARGKARLLGLTEQLLGGGLPSEGPIESDGEDFRYAGSLGPLPLAPALESALARLGQALADAFGLVGLFGVDGVLDSDSFWPVEVNPRYTASVEVIERGAGLSAVRLHQAACLQGKLPEAIPGTTEYPWCGKYIIYAPREASMPEGLVGRLMSESAGLAWPRVADIPSAGSQIRAGQPVLTVLAAAKSRAAIVRELKRSASEIAAELFA